MRKRTLAGVLAVGFAIFAGATAGAAARGAEEGAEAEAEAEAVDWDVYWQNGTRLESSDGKFELKFGGRIQADFMAASEDEAIRTEIGDIEGGSEFRRARIFIEGLLWKRFEFRAQYDFAGGDVDFNDVYLGITDLPAVGGVRVGHFKEPFGMEQLTSSKYVAFMERGVTQDATNEGRNMGIMLHNAILDDRLTWAAGVFQPSDNAGEFEGDEIALTGRVSGLVRWQDEGRRLLHLGLAVTDRDAVDDVARIAARPEMHLAPDFIDTGDFDAGRELGARGEFALVQGPFWIFSEVVVLDVDTPATGTLRFDGYKLQAGWYLTGEHRRYKKGVGVWDRQKPRRPFLDGGGPGAWEIAVRISGLDANSDPVLGGEGRNTTVGVNWYPNSATRWLLNWVRADLKDVGVANLYAMRFQVDF